MKQIYWTNFALTELKNIFLYYQMVADKRVANKIKKSIFTSTKKLINNPLIGALEDEFAISIDTDDIIDFSYFEKGKEILKKYKVDL